MSKKKTSNIPTEQLIEEFVDGILTHNLIMESPELNYRIANQNVRKTAATWEEIEHRDIDIRPLLRKFLQDPRERFLLGVTVYSAKYLPDETVETLRRISEGKSKYRDKAKLRLELLLRDLKK
jgi:hypothetical protein